MQEQRKDNQTLQNYTYKQSNFIDNGFMTQSFMLGNHGKASIISDGRFIIFKSDRIRLLVRGNQIDQEPTGQNYSLYEWKDNNQVWRPIFEVKTLFVNKGRELIRIITYGHFDDQDCFLSKPLQFIFGQGRENLKRKIRQKRLLPNILTK